jgi:hypothetical protein
VKDSQPKKEVGEAEGAADGLTTESSIRGAGALRPAGPRSPRVSLEAEVPEELFEGMREFIRHHPQWDQYSVITSALAGFLFQNGARDPCVKDHYLAALFSDA